MRAANKKIIFLPDRRLILLTLSGKVLLWERDRKRKHKMLLPQLNERMFSSNH